MALEKQYVVVETDSDGDIVAVWGPFSTEDAAMNWDGIPSGPKGGYATYPLHDAPEWPSEDE